MAGAQLLQSPDGAPVCVEPVEQPHDARAPEDDSAGEQQDHDVAEDRGRLDCRGSR
jgi:hypothetical protein